MNTAYRAPCPGEGCCESRGGHTTGCRAMRTTCPHASTIGGKTFGRMRGSIFKCRGAAIPAHRMHAHRHAQKASADGCCAGRGGSVHGVQPNAHQPCPARNAHTTPDHAQQETCAGAKGIKHKCLKVLLNVKTFLHAPIGGKTAVGAKANAGEQFICGAATNSVCPHARPPLCGALPRPLTLPPNHAVKSGSKYHTTGMLVCRAIRADGFHVSSWQCRKSQRRRRRVAGRDTRPGPPTAAPISLPPFASGRPRGDGRKTLSRGRGRN